MPLKDFGIATLAGIDGNVIPAHDVALRGYGEYTAEEKGVWKVVSALVPNPNIEDGPPVPAVLITIYAG